MDIYGEFGVGGTRSVHKNGLVLNYHVLTNNAVFPES